MKLIKKVARILLNSLATFLPRRKNFAHKFKRALAWVDTYTVEGAGIAVNSKQSSIPYPEVTGYFIPTLLQWGEVERATAYGAWLLSIQNEDGSWNDPNGNKSYVFDSGQILKGLLALWQRDKNNKALYNALYNGCAWILSCQQENGAIRTPHEDAWSDEVPEAVHLYCLSPIIAFAKHINKPEWVETVNKSIRYYMEDVAHLEWRSLNHFHAYIVEALIDLDFKDIAQRIMDTYVEPQLTPRGHIPAYPGQARWGCTTGSFQYALIWYKLGGVRNTKKAARVFNFVSQKQNKSGGFYGSYGLFPRYFPRAEISWAVKYFLDVLPYYIQAFFDEEEHIFPRDIEPTDGRFTYIENIVAPHKKPLRICDVGCGKGRFVKLLHHNFPEHSYDACDLSPELLKEVPAAINTDIANLLYLPYEDNTFDIVFCVEALEHAVNIPRAVSELVRITKPEGAIIIIDKNAAKQGYLKLAPWECWFNPDALAKAFNNHNCKSTYKVGLDFDGVKGSNNVFVGWHIQKQGVKK